jgi:hypothetical protein
MTTGRAVENIHNDNASLRTSPMVPTTEEGDVEIEEEAHLQTTPAT